MQVILTQNVPKLGKRGELKEVRDGFAQNFLIPRGLARTVSQDSLANLEAERRAAVRTQQESLRESQRLAAALEQAEVKIVAKAGEGGKLFGSITKTRVAEALQAQGLGIKKDQVCLADPIRELGGHRVTIELPHGLEAEVEVTVIAS